MVLSDLPASGVGIGLRRSLVKELQQYKNTDIDFLEVSPENWMGLGGRSGSHFSWFAERYPLFCHGLSLSIGSTEALDIEFLKALKIFLKRFHIKHYSEHLSYCSGGGGHLYDLMPLPFTDEAVQHVVSRVKQVQDILEQKISLENVSYYAVVGTSGDQGLSEADFVRAVVEESGCGLLLDVNNIYVNSINHRYDASQFLQSMPAESVSYYHVAGHYDEAPDLKIDSHGAPVKDPVWQLLDEAYQWIGVKPTLLERDFNIPPLDTLLEEARVIAGIQKGRIPARSRAVA